MHEPARAGELGRSVLDPEHAAAAIGFRPETSLAEGLAATWQSLHPTPEAPIAARTQEMLVPSREGARRSRANVLPWTSRYQHDDRLIRPWRTAALVACAVAAIELLILVVVGGALIAKPSTAGTTRPTAKHQAATASTARRAKAVPRQEAARSDPGCAPRPPQGVRARAQRQRAPGRRGGDCVPCFRRGYRIGGVANAPSSDFTRSLVMYRRGFEGEGRRLARDLGIRIVGPLDGLRVSQLHGSHAVVVVGA